MSHSTGSESRLNRLKPGQSFGSAEYAREELVAELTAALVSSQYGMTKHVKSDSAAYLKGWLSNLKEDPLESKRRPLVYKDNSFGCKAFCIIHRPACRCG